MGVRTCDSVHEIYMFSRVCIPNRLQSEALCMHCIVSVSTSVTVQYALIRTYVLVLISAFFCEAPIPSAIGVRLLL